MDKDNNKTALQKTTSAALQQRSQQTAVSLSERYKEVTTIAQAFNLKETPLTKCEGDVQGSVKIHLAALARFLNTRLTLTDEHIEFIADNILADEYYKWLKTADLKIFFDSIKMCRYGDFYGNLNTIAFFKALDSYMMERNAEIERIHIEEAKQQREALKDPVHLSYFINEDGRLAFTEAKLQELEQQRQRKEAIDEETRRKQQVAKEAAL